MNRFAKSGPETNGHHKPPRVPRFKLEDMPAYGIPLATATELDGAINADLAKGASRVEATGKLEIAIQVVLSNKQSRKLVPVRREKIRGHPAFVCYPLVRSSAWKRDTQMDRLDTGFPVTWGTIEYVLGDPIILIVSE